ITNCARPRGRLRLSVCRPWGSRTQGGAGIVAAFRCRILKPSRREVRLPRVESIPVRHGHRAAQLQRREYVARPSSVDALSAAVIRPSLPRRRRAREGGLDRSWWATWSYAPRVRIVSAERRDRGLGATLC